MSPAARPPLDAPALVQAVQAMEARLDALDQALRGADPGELDAAAEALQRELARTVKAFEQVAAERRAAVQPSVSPPAPLLAPHLAPHLAHRLALAQSRVAALQPVVHRAAASVGRTLAVILAAELPGDQAAYLALGAAASRAHPSRTAL